MYELNELPIKSFCGLHLFQETGLKNDCTLTFTTLDFFLVGSEADTLEYLSLF